MRDWYPQLSPKIIQKMFYNRLMISTFYLVAYGLLVTPACVILCISAISRQISLFGVPYIYFGLSIPWVYRVLPPFEWYLLRKPQADYTNVIYFILLWYFQQCCCYNTSSVSLHLKLTPQKVSLMSFLLCSEEPHSISASWLDSLHRVTYMYITVPTISNFQRTEDYKLYLTSFNQSHIRTGQWFKFFICCSTLIMQADKLKCNSEFDF